MQLSEAADMLGVHYQTAYAWVRRGELPATKQGRTYHVLDADLASFAAARRQPREPEPVVRVRDWQALAGRLYRAVLNGEETRIRAELNGLAGTISMLDLCDRVIAPALRKIGDGWESGRVSIAQEHRASAICERLITIRSRPPAGRPRGIAVAATPEGERHSLPALMAAACLREDHWQVHHLASDLPASEVLQLASGVRADLVVLSATTSAAVTAARAMSAARAVTAADGGPQLLAGQPGDSLHQLIQLARAAKPQRAPTAQE